jgi:hypothetical protein
LIEAEGVFMAKGDKRSEIFITVISSYSTVLGPVDSFEQAFELVFSAEEGRDILGFRGAFGDKDYAFLEKDKVSANNSKEARFLIALKGEDPLPNAQPLSYSQPLSYDRKIINCNAGKNEPWVLFTVARKKPLTTAEKASVKEACTAVLEKRQKTLQHYDASLKKFNFTKKCIIWPPIISLAIGIAAILAGFPFVGNVTSAVFSVIAPIAVTISAIGFGIGLLTFLRFAAWKIFASYNKRRYEYFVRSRRHAMPKKGEDYVSYLKLLKANFDQEKQALDENYSYRAFLSEMRVDVFAWMKKHYIQSIALVFASALSVFIMVSFFPHGPLFGIVQPVFELVHKLLSAGFNLSPETAAANFITWGFFVAISVLIPKILYGLMNIRTSLKFNLKSNGGIRILSEKNSKSALFAAWLAYNPDEIVSNFNEVDEKGVIIDEDESTSSKDNFLPPSSFTSHSSFTPHPYKDDTSFYQKKNFSDPPSTTQTSNILPTGEGNFGFSGFDSDKSSDDKFTTRPRSNVNNRNLFVTGDDNKVDNSFNTEVGGGESFSNISPSHATVIGNRNDVNNSTNMVLNVEKVSDISSSQAQYQGNDNKINNSTNLTLGPEVREVSNIGNTTVHNGDGSSSGQNNTINNSINITGIEGNSKKYGPNASQEKQKVFNKSQHKDKLQASLQKTRERLKKNPATKNSPHNDPSKRNTNCLFGDVDPRVNASGNTDSTFVNVGINTSSQQGNNTSSPQQNYSYYNYFPSPFYSNPQGQNSPDFSRGMNQININTDRSNVFKGPIGTSVQYDSNGAPASSASSSTVKRVQVGSQWLPTNPNAPSWEEVDVYDQNTNKLMKFKPYNGEVREATYQEKKQWQQQQHWQQQQNPSGSGNVTNNSINIKDTNGCSFQNIGNHIVYTTTNNNK